MSVKHSARRLGVAHKMLGKIIHILMKLQVSGDLERRAREQNVEVIVFDASTPGWFQLFDRSKGEFAAQFQWPSSTWVLGQLGEASPLFRSIGKTSSLLPG